MNLLLVEPHCCQMLAFSHDQCQNKWKMRYVWNCMIPHSATLIPVGYGIKAKSKPSEKLHHFQLNNHLWTRNQQAAGLVVPGH